jgi:hypothetical protein
LNNALEWKNDLISSGVMGKKICLPIPGSGTAIGVWIPRTEIPLLDAIAEQKNLSRSATAREIIQGYLKSHSEFCPNDQSPAA